MRILIPRPMPFRKSCLGQNQDNRNYGLSRLRNDVLHQQGDHQNARRPTEAWRLSRAAIRWRWLQGTTRCPWWFAHPCTSWHPSTIPMLLTRIRFTSSFLRPKSFEGWTERSSHPFTPTIRSSNTYPRTWLPSTSRISPAWPHLISTDSSVNIITLMITNFDPDIFISTKNIKFSICFDFRTSLNWNVINHLIRLQWVQRLILVFTSL